MNTDDDKETMIIKALLMNLEPNKLMVQHLENKCSAITNACQSSKVAKKICTDLKASEEYKPLFHLCSNSVEKLEWVFQYTPDHYDDKIDINIGVVPSVSTALQTIFYNFLTPRASIPVKPDFQTSHAFSFPIGNRQSSVSYMGENGENLGYFRHNSREKISEVILKRNKIVIHALAKALDGCLDVNTNIQVKKIKNGFLVEGMRPN